LTRKNLTFSERQIPAIAAAVAVVVTVTLEEDDRALGARYGHPGQRRFVSSSDDFFMIQWTLCNSSSVSFDFAADIGTSSQGFVVYSFHGRSRMVSPLDIAVVSVIRKPGSWGRLLTLNGKSMIRARAQTARVAYSFKLGCDLGEEHFNKSLLIPGRNGFQCNESAVE
jgi:hypothetical protein